MGIVEPFKRVLRVTAHPQILTLELRVPMGACSGQYGRSILSKAGIDSSQYSGHRFCIGAATAAANGIEDSIIQTLLCWKSSAYLR